MKVAARNSVRVPGLLKSSAVMLTSFTVGPKSFGAAPSMRLPGVAALSAPSLPMTRAAMTRCR
jgi:hypothetical protein